MAIGVLFGFAALAHPAGADFQSISPAVPGGPGGTITFSGIDPGDPTSATLNTNFTALAPIAFSATATSTDPIVVIGNEVNRTGSAWGAITATVTSGSATFVDPNDPFGGHGTFTDAMGYSVAISADGRSAVFSGGRVSSGDSLFVSLGLVSKPSLPFTIGLVPSAAPNAVPGPPGLALLAIGGAWLGLFRRRLGRRSALGLAMVGLAALAPGSARAQGGPRVVGNYAGKLAIRPVGQVPGSPTQMAFGPDGALYVMTADAGPIRFPYDPATTALGQPIRSAPGIFGIGIGFHGAEMYLSAFDGSLHKLTDDNRNGVYGEAGEVALTIASGIPQGDHNIDQIQIAGDTLYVGIGRRTINGHFGAWTSGALDDLGGRGFFGGGLGRTYGDSAYNGTIAWIQDLTRVAPQPNSANAFQTNPPTLSRALIQHDDGPFRSTDPGKLVVHSAGSRNPFGLCLDNGGNLWFTNNFNRTATLGNGQAGFGLRGDQPDSDLSKDVHDQLFQAIPGGDYGYTDANWRGVNPMLTPSAPGYRRALSTTFDNSFNQGPYTIHDPANPVGLGPSASADGCAFSYSARLPAELQGNVFIARFNGSITEAPGGLRRTLTYADLVAVDTATGTVRQVAAGFANPLAVLADDASNRLLVADYGSKTIYAIQAVGP